MNRVLSANLARYGVDLSPEDCLRQFKGGSMLDVPAYALQMGKTLPDNWVPDFYQEVYQVFRDEGVDVIDGIPELLDILDDTGIPYCVASNGSEEKMSVTLGHNGLWDRFSDRCFSAHRYGSWKPNPAIFLAAAEHFAVDVGEVIVVEDSASGAKAAQTAGMRCFGLAMDDSGSDLAEVGAVVIRHISEIAPRCGLAAKGED